MENTILSTITKGDKTISINSFFGVWKIKPQTLEGIRKKGWSRRYNFLK